MSEAKVLIVADRVADCYFIAMSIASYRRNRAAGVTGRWTGTCFPASLEQISPRNSLEPDTYVRYTEVLDYIETLQGQEKRQANPFYKILYEELIEELGSTYDQVVFARLKSPCSFRSGVRRLLQEGCRVTVDLMSEGCIAKVGDAVVHSVGLRAVEGTDAVSLVSTWVPPELRGQISLDELFPHVAQINEPTRTRYAFNDCNVFAMPPS